MIKKVDKSADKKTPARGKGSTQNPQDKLDTKVSLIKGDNTIESRAGLSEDEFALSYYSGATGEGTVIEPPYVFKTLIELTQENNTLGQCVTAMEVNIDGTGADIKPKHDEKVTAAEEAQIDAALDFFAEPFPGQSFMTQRRALRRDLESTGNAFLEVMRNAKREIIFLKPIDVTTMRCARLAEAVPVKRSVMRNGVNFEVEVLLRERVFVQKIGTTTVYFKEFNASRDINKSTGEWAEKGSDLAAAERGTEVIHLTVNKDTNTPYGLPRWLNQLPSVLGSRAAEELNLDYFSSGGIPPVLIIVEGGAFVTGAKTQLENMLDGKAKKKNKAAVVEVMSTSGGLDSKGSVKVQVERFGSEKQQDSMFEKYDENSEKRVRSSFRLPPLFVGRTDDYTHATAITSYMIGESQVFAPERVEFDEIMTVTILKELGFGDFKYISKPITLKDRESQLKGLDLASKLGSVSGEDMIDAINEATGTTLPFTEEGISVSAKAAESTTTTTGAVAKSTGIQKMDSFDVLELATEYTAYAGLDGSKKKFTKGEQESLKKRMKSMTKADRDLFDSIVASRIYTDTHHDTEGMKEIGCCATALITGDKHA